MKVHEIAAELRLNSKAILEKTKELGIVAKNMRDELSDDDVASIRSAFGKGNAGKSKAAPTKAKPAPGKKAPVKSVKTEEADEAAKPKAPAPKPAPKRITKEQLAAEERKKADPNAEDLDADVAPKVAPKKQQLKVAYTDKEEPTAKKPKATAAEKPAEKKPPVIVSTEPAHSTGSAKQSTAGEKKVEEKPIEKKPTENKVVEKKSAEKKSPVTTSDARKSGSSEKKPEKTEKPKKKHAPAESKATDKKPDRGGRSADKNKKPARSSDKRRNNTDDFRGSKRSPILEDASLEKRPTKNKHRSRVVDKSEPDETQIIIEELEEIGTVILSVPITVAGFAEQTGVSITDVIMALMTMGIMANVNQNLDETVTQLLADELGISIYIAEDEGEIIETGLDVEEDKEEDLSPRAPIVTVMGHVDHGKTSLLDAIRSTSVTKGEAGGITQHIGASEVSINGQKIVFLDTPGHEAFTAMRARGAHATDIAVLVVAADDGVMPQTLESISHAKAAGVPIIVAINKIDKEGANPDKVKTELSEHNILVEDWGGDTISVPVSAKSGEGITSLLEMILLQSEVLELKANPDRLAVGTVIEARLDKTKGAVATLLVMNGTLETGDSIVVGVTSGRIRAMTDFSGKTIKKAGPATAVEVTGLSEVPWAGDTFNAVKDDKLARDIAESRKLRQRDEVMLKNSGASLDTLFSEISTNELKELNIIVKGDVQGSVGALTAQLEKLSNDDVKIRIVHRGVGAITESDVMLAATSNAVIIGFNVRPGAAVASTAEKDSVEIRTYRVIYEAIGDVEAAMKGMLDPEFREKVLGECEVRETFKVPGGNVIAGSYVTNGQIKRSAEVRIVRDGIVIHEGKISSLRRFKDDVREVATGYECGIGIDGYNDIKVGDIIEAFEMEEIER